jgi:hypothetical protein
MISAIRNLVGVCLMILASKVMDRKGRAMVMVAMAQSAAEELENREREMRDRYGRR